MSTREDDPVLPKEFLTFIIGKEEYAIDILKVQEIRGYENPTTIANAPEFLKGVIDLRGIIVPIVDMRIKFNIFKVDYTPFTVVVILAIGGRHTGIVVDSVSEVLTLEPDQIKATPAFSSSLDATYILGICTLADRSLIVVDIEKLIFNGKMPVVRISQDSLGEFA